MQSTTFIRNGITVTRYWTSSFDDAPAPKRRRVSTARHAMQDAFEPRSQDLWFHDGTVIVAATGMSFKVHAGVLERHSTVFRELLVVKPRQKVEKAEGCRVLRVEDDGRVLTELLLILYDGFTRCVVDQSFLQAMLSNYSEFFDRSKPIKFMKLRALALLAVKYRIEAVLKEAIARLEVVFPVEFVEARVQSESYYAELENTPIDEIDTATAILAVALARDIDEENPSAFTTMALYFCCQIMPDALFEAWPCDDEEEPEVVQLSPRDLRACVTGTQKLMEQMVKVRQSVLDVNETACATKACRRARHSVFREWTVNGTMLGRGAPLDSIDWRAGPLKTLCNVCRPAIVALYDERRKDAFNRLGETFGITSWPHHGSQP